MVEQLGISPREYLYGLGEAPSSRLCQKRPAGGPVAEDGGHGLLDRLTRTSPLYLFNWDTACLRPPPSRPPLEIALEKGSAGLHVRQGASRFDS